VVKIAAAVLVLVFAAPASAAEPAPAPELEGWAYTLANELMSPYCPGRTLSDCPSPQASDLRLWIVAQEAAGASREEVEATLYERFGDEIRSTPKPEGWGLTAYVVPLAAFLAGGVVVVLFLRHVRGAETGSGLPEPAPGSAPPDADLERIVEREIARS
jgi:cytochrome c-type biogenesis protein CcmH